MINEAFSSENPKLAAYLWDTLPSKPAKKNLPTKFDGLWHCSTEAIGWDKLKTQAPRSKENMPKSERVQQKNHVQSVLDKIFGGDIY